MSAQSSSPIREITFYPTNPAVTRTVGFLVRSVPLGVWVLMYLLFSIPMLWDIWQRLATAPVPVWRWGAALVFPLMLFGLLCVLQKSNLRLTGPATINSDGLYLGKRGRVKEYWSTVACTVEPVTGTPGVYRLSIRANSAFSKLTGSTTIYSALTEDREQAEQFAAAFRQRYPADS